MVALDIRYLLALISIISLSAHAADLTGRIVSVHDGDTVTLLDSTNQQHKIRLKGIDALESHQAFGQKSKTNLAAMVFNREVVAECGKQDRYRRDICVIKVDGKDANEAQVAAGMAWWYETTPGSKQRSSVPMTRPQSSMRRSAGWVYGLIPTRCHRGSGGDPNSFANDSRRRATYAYITGSKAVVAVIGTTKYYFSSQLFCSSGHAKSSDLNMCLKAAAALQTMQQCSGNGQYHLLTS
jgi:hypothetical protein